MDINAIISLIGSLGFPIVACIYLAKTGEKQTEAHKEEMDKVSEAINEMRLAIVALTEKLNK